MYGRDYGNRNFVERAANTVRGWFDGGHGHRGGYGQDYRGGYGQEYRGGGTGGGTGGGMYGGDHNRGGWGGGQQYREMGDLHGRGYDRGMTGGAHNWTGHNDSWNRGPGGGARGGWGHEHYDSMQTGGYRPRHGQWDVDWDDDDTRDMAPRGGYGGDYRSGGMQGGRGFAGNQGRYDEPYRGNVQGPARARPMNRDWGGDEDRTMPFGAASRGRPAMNRGGQAPHFDPADVGMGNYSGGIGGAYGPYGSYGLERFRSNNSGGVSLGNYYTGYGVGTGYRG